MNNIAPKLQKCWTHKIAFKIISKMLKQPNFFYSQPSTLSKEALEKFYLSTTSGLSFMISSLASSRSLTSYAYLVTKIGNHNLNRINRNTLKTCMQNATKNRNILDSDVTPMYVLVGISCSNVNPYI